MLKYLIIPLSRNAVSFCHYQRGNGDDRLIDKDILNSGIFWAMKENLNVQFLYPDSILPEEYKEIIDTIDHASIVGSQCEDNLLKDEAEVIVFDSFSDTENFKFQKDKSYVIRTDKESFFDSIQNIKSLVKTVDRLVVVITELQNFTESDFKRYSEILDSLIPEIVAEYTNNHLVHFNLLTDRLWLDDMNNCNAGDESITLAPDGKFYVCPAFYLDGSYSVGDIKNGLDIKNPQLYRLDHAPICRNCDAFQCKRCIWLNRKTTLEVNTPSHEQCVISHIERNASKKLLEEIRKIGDFLPDKEIKEIDYLDPFDKIKG